MGGLRSVLLAAVLLGGGAVALYFALRTNPVAESPGAEPHGEVDPSAEGLELPEVADRPPAPPTIVDLPPPPKDGALTEARIRHIRGNVLAGGNDLWIAMKQLIELGPKGAPLLPALREVISRREGIDRMAAMVALMAVEGSRRHMRELANWALAGPRREGLLLLSDPVAGNALLAAVRRSRFVDPTLGVEQVADLLCEDPSAAATVVAQRLVNAEPRDVHIWIEIIRGYRPPPLELGDALRRCLLADEEARATAVIEALSAREMDLGPLAGVLVDPLLCCLERSIGDDVAGRVQLVQALGNLDTDDPRVISSLISSLDGVIQERVAAVRALQKLGPRAVSAVRALVEEYWTAGGSRTATIRALLATRSNAAMPVFLNVINIHGGAADQHILDVLVNLPEVEGAAVALPAIRWRYSEFCYQIRGLAAFCAARIDLGAESQHTVTLVAWALQEPNASTRAAGTSAASRLERIPPPVAGALAAMSARDSNDDRKYAVKAMAALTRHGESARVFVPALEALVDDYHVGMIALSSIAVLDTENETFRRKLEEMAYSDSPRKRGSAVWLLRHIKDPGPDDVALLRTILGSDDRRFRKARESAKELLSTAVWREAAGL